MTYIQADLMGAWRGPTNVSGLVSASARGGSVHKDLARAVGSLLDLVVGVAVIHNEYAVNCCSELQFASTAVLEVRYLPPLLELASSTAVLADWHSPALLACVALTAMLTDL